LLAQGGEGGERENEITDGAAADDEDFAGVHRDFMETAKLLWAIKLPRESGGASL
jgi:hypothetical protein